MVRTCLLFSFLLFASLLLAQQPRFALVIGNGNYEYASLGQTPVNSAKAMYDVLSSAGFEVDYFDDLDQDSINKVVINFGRKIKHRSGVALFYYCGHGVQKDERNYLVPITSELTHEDEIEAYCVPINGIVSKMKEGNNPINIIILDACRAFKIQRGDMSLRQGLFDENYNFSDLVVSYATTSGGLADLNGEDGLSLYTSQLIKHLKTPGLELEVVLKNTRRDVADKSNRQQQPDQSGYLNEDFYFFIKENKPSELIEQNLEGINRTATSEESKNKTADINPQRLDVVKNDKFDQAIGVTYGYFAVDGYEPERYHTILAHYLLAKRFGGLISFGLGLNKSPLLFDDYKRVYPGWGVAGGYRILNNMQKKIRFYTFVGVSGVGDVVGSWNFEVLGNIKKIGFELGYLQDFDFGNGFNFGVHYCF